MKAGQPDCPREDIQQMQISIFTCKSKPTHTYSYIVNLDLD